MNYSQYLEQHQQLTKELNGASKEFEDLRSSYDNASPEARSNLEPELKESINRVEAARSDLSSLESQNPECEQARQQSLTSDARLDQTWQEHWQNHSDPVVSERFKTAYDFYQQGGYNNEEALQAMKGINFNREVSVETIQPNEILKQYQIPEANEVGNYFTIDSDKLELGIEGDSLSSQNRVPKFYIAHEEIKALKSTSSDLENWTENKELNYGGGTQYFIAKEETSSLKNVNSFFTQNNLNDDAYANARSREDILNKFEESYRNDVPELENQQQQEQSQGISY